jgi:hypothetical protein
MSSVIAGIFKSKETLEEFREAVIALDSAFSLGLEDLLEIGQAYCDRYPESYSKRNPQNVQIGYTMARICVIEKALEGTEQKIKKIYRSMFYSLNAIEEKIIGLIQADGCEQVSADYQRIYSRIKHIEGLINELPRGMIKEKFIGGLSVIYNVVYLVNHFVDKCRQELNR